MDILSMAHLPTKCTTCYYTVQQYNNMLTMLAEVQYMDLHICSRICHTYSLQVAVYDLSWIGGQASNIAESLS